MIVDNGGQAQNATTASVSTSTNFFVYICTRTTADPFIPAVARDLPTLSRDVSDAFLALTGGRYEVGTLRFYPVQRTVANHLLCDGREMSRQSFPELADYLGNTQGIAADPANFVLPDYTAGFAPAVNPAPEVVNNGTVTSGAGLSDYTGVADSGGNYRPFGSLATP